MPAIRNAATHRFTDYLLSMIYTKDGRPLKVSGQDLFARSGKHVARIRNGKAYGPDGRYVGTIVNDRLIQIFNS